MTQEEMWRAVIKNDESYDGIFFYSVKSTGIYCRPSCKSKTPKRENVCFFDTAEEARNAGFRPCKRCRSDLMEYHPMKEIAAKAKQLLDSCFDEKRELKQGLRQLGISHRRMSEIFKDEYGITLHEYIKSRRLEEAIRMLIDTDEDIIDIAYAVGFGGPSSFYSFFKSETGMPPLSYRKEHRK
ncbi:Ada metal-binding domain-containing protein [Sedimentibacter sp.]|uniref:bifunctional transcriptional activator/DNA repair enzyme AdaA n=1 Tax=Sedimentibacter sp. TaxID=1960295 RepID=UPI0028A1C749|nr:Ada metal-binding domain-containing protein [Sedimentibacter sp.]